MSIDLLINRAYQQGTAWRNEALNEVVEAFAGGTCPKPSELKDRLRTNPKTGGVYGAAYQFAHAVYMAVNLNISPVKAHGYATKLVNTKIGDKLSRLYEGDAKQQKAAIESAVSVLAQDKKDSRLDYLYQQRDKIDAEISTLERARLVPSA